MAGAAALEEAGRSFDGDGDSPAGEATDEENIKSSKFMASDWDCCACVCRSIDFRSCAMPLGALDTLGAFKVFGALGALVELVEAVVAAVAAIVVFFRDNLAVIVDQH